MRHLLQLVISIFLILGLGVNGVAQDSIKNTSFKKIPSAYFDRIVDKSNDLNNKLDKKTEKILADFQKQEMRLMKKLRKVDSLIDQNYLVTTEQRINELKQKLKTPQRLKQYMPFLDTLKTSIRFLESNKDLIENTKGIDTKITQSLGKLNELESKLQGAEEVKQFLSEKRQLLNEQLSKFGMVKELKKMNKQVYYYSQQINEYKEIIKDKKKIERKSIELLSQTKVFKDFMKKNSMLGSMFRMPINDPSVPAYTQVLGSLQTRTQINQTLQNQLGGTGSNAQQRLQQSIGQAQGELQKLKSRFQQFGGSAELADMPDFKPNSQKSKSLWRRLEGGLNIQSQRPSGFLPASSDIGFSLGYKISDNSVVGIGGSYKVGWGTLFKDIQVTHQGASARSYVDIKMKKLFWISGGFEMNYLSEIKNVDQLKHLNAWQTSGLIGITRKIPVKSALVKNTKVQLLWDFLSYYQVPRPHPLIFRVGYQF